MVSKHHFVTCFLLKRLKQFQGPNDPQVSILFAKGTGDL